MSLIIPCGHCGPRPVEEFRYGGELADRPPPNADADGRVDDVLFDEAWMLDKAWMLDEAWMLTNAEGPTTERWFHAGGCRRWVTIRRDTRNDRVPGEGLG